MKNKKTLKFIERARQSQLVYYEKKTLVKDVKHIEFQA